MAALPPIDDSNTYATKTEGGNPGDPNDVVSAADLNALKARVGENRDQANAALAATAGAVVDQTASFSLASTDHGKVVRVDSAGGAVVITIPHTLFGSIIASGVFRTTILVTNADEAITIAGSGGIVPQYFGRKTIRIGDLITITVTSASLALVDVREWSDPLAPYVQGTHTATTRTLALGDSAQIIPLSGASNAVAVTIPHTLYDAVLGRAFQTTLVALNVTNAITLAGSGGLVLTYYGDSTITAGDIIRISVESATVCRVEVVKTGAGGGSGDVMGPGGAVTDDGIVTWSGTGGTDVQDSGVTIASLAKTTAITVYDTASSGNYTIPTGAKAVYRRVIGAGGGGGGGGASTGASARSGGAGGAGGAVATGWISGAELAGGTLAYVVGAGGTAGAGTASGDGADGGVGGTSNAGALFAYGGGGGRRGLTIAAVAGGGGGGGTGGPGTVGAAGTVAGGLPGASSAAAIGGQGAQGGTTTSACAEYGGGAGGGHNTSAFFLGGSSLYGGGGGGAGAGTNAFPAVNTPSAGGASGTYTPGGGGAAGASGASPTAGAPGAAADSTRCGAGGGGGGATVTANTAGAAGGVGGAGGGGGGGGGSGTNTAAGGAGGVGGAGRVEFYAFF